MAQETWISSTAELLRSSVIFRELSEQQLKHIWSQAKIRNLLRGEVLFRQHTRSDAVYLVVSGRFEVWQDGQQHSINEVGVGESIGEIGFFSGGARTATIVAARDSKILELDLAAFEAVAHEVPTIYEALLRAVALRLSEGTHPRDALVGVARTVAVVSGGYHRIPQPFIDHLHKTISRQGKGLILTKEVIKKNFPGASLEDPIVSNYFNVIESEFELVIYLAEEELSDWTRKAIRQADQILIVVTKADSSAPNACETFAFEHHPPERRRLLCLHERRTGAVQGTMVQLQNRDVSMHHHISLEDDLDFVSLYRFLTGQAVGFVASGGGGLGPAHIGIFKAFQEAGVTFDILGGTSIGAAALAGFSTLMSAEEIDRATHDVFVQSRGFKRFTIPRYALLDHFALDEALRRQFKGINIEDAWRPYFAVATILDGSSQGPYLIRRGPLWKAVRASGSLPAVLPPFFTDDGRMLVDGGVIENIPLKSMKGLKTGPNVVVHFGMRDAQQFYTGYEAIPNRWRLVQKLLTPGGRRKLPAIPGPIAVIRSCLVMNQNASLLPVGKSDLVLKVPVFPGAYFLDFDRHSDVFEAAYEWGRNQIEQLLKSGDPALAAILATPRAT